MADSQALVRCRSCGAVNRIPADKARSVLKCGSCGAALVLPAAPVSVGSANFSEEVLRWPGVVLVEFWSDNCGYCRMLAPVLRQLAADKAGLLKVAQVKADEEPQLSVNYQVQGVPSLFLFSGGRLLNRVAGALPRQQLEEWIRANAGV